MLSTENKYLLKLLSDVLHEKDVDSTEDLVWESVYSEMKAQTVHAFAGLAVSSLGISDSSKEVILRDVASQLNVFYTILEAQDEIINLLSKNGINCIILKGCAAAMYYKTPEYRCMGDIDLIVNPEVFEDAYNLLIDNGYKLMGEKDRNPRHVSLMKDGVEFELHHHFSSSNNSDENEILDGYVFDGLVDPVFSNINGYEFPVLPRLANGLVLLGHINCHLKNGLGLRQILDWMCYVENCLDDDFWNDEFSDVAEKIGMRKLAICATAMCKKYLGLESSITWCDGIFEEDPEIIDELIEYIFAHGNFGRNDVTGVKTVIVLRILKSPIKSFKKIQNFGLEHHPELKDRKILSHFAWAYQLRRWVRRGKESGVNVGNISSYNDKEKTELDFLKRLGITRLK